MTARYPFLKWWQNESANDENVVEAVMKNVGIWHLRDRAVNELSGGERQRVFLAKALAQETELLLLDEPTAALDLVYADEIFRQGRQYCESGKTIFIVVHDLELAAKFCTRLLLISEGHLVADGLPKEVLTAKNLKKLFICLQLCMKIHILHSNVFLCSRMMQLILNRIVVEIHCRLI